MKKTVHTNMPGMISNEDETGRLIETAIEKVQSHIVALCEISGSEVSLIGTGFFIHLESSYYFVTAAHCINELKINRTDLRLVFSGNGHKISFDYFAGTSDDKTVDKSQTDVAFGLVSKHSRHYDKIKHIAITEVIDSSIEHTKIERYLILGFPGSKNRNFKYDSRKNAVSINGGFYAFGYTRSTEHTAESLGLNSEHHIIINWPKRDNKRNRIVSPEGISGSPVFHLPPTDGAKPLLTGVFTSVVPNRLVGFFTRISIVLDFIKAVEHHRQAK